MVSMTIIICIANAFPNYFVCFLSKVLLAPTPASLQEWEDHTAWAKLQLEGSQQPQPARGRTQLKPLLSWSSLWTFFWQTRVFPADFRNAHLNAEFATSDLVAAFSSCNRLSNLIQGKSLWKRFTTDLKAQIEVLSGEDKQIFCDSWG
jgi:hypothetical protein